MAQIPNTESDPRTRILLAAGPIFAERGFEGSTVREISQRAGVNLAAVNYYFGDKERLYVTTVRYARESREKQEPLPAWDDLARPESRLRDFVLTMLRRMVGLGEAPWEVKLMMREILQPTSACRELVRDYFRPTFDTLLAIIQQIIDTPVSRERLERLGFSVMGQCVFYRVAGGVVAMLVETGDLQQFYSPESLADHITEFTLSALRGLEGAQAASVDTALPKGIQS